MTFMVYFGKDDIWKIASVDPQGVATIDSTVDRLRMKLENPLGVLVDYDTASGKEPTGIATSSRKWPTFWLEAHRPEDEPARRGPGGQPAARIAG